MNLKEKAITEILDHPHLLDLDEDGYEYPQHVRPSTVRNLMRWHAVDEDEARKLLHIMGRKGFLSEARAWGTRVNAPNTFWRNLEEIEKLVKENKWPPRPRPSGTVPEDVARHTTVGGMEILYSTEQIKQMARKRGLSTAGSKRDIIKRILG